MWVYNKLFSISQAGDGLAEEDKHRYALIFCFIGPNFFLAQLAQAFTCG